MVNKLSVSGKNGQPVFRLLSGAKHLKALTKFVAGELTISMRGEEARHGNLLYFRHLPVKIALYTDLTESEERELVTWTSRA